MSDIYLTDDQIKEYDYFDLEVCKAIANAASEKAQRVTAWNIVDWILKRDFTLKNDCEEDEDFGEEYYLVSEKEITEYLLFHDIKREG